MENDRPTVGGHVLHDDERPSVDDVLGAAELAARRKEALTAERDHLRAAVDEVWQACEEEQLVPFDVLERALQQHELLAAVPATPEVFAVFETHLMAVPRWQAVTEHEHDDVHEGCRWCAVPRRSVTPPPPCVPRLPSEQYADVGPYVWIAELRQWWPEGAALEPVTAEELLTDD